MTTSDHRPLKAPPHWRQFLEQRVPFEVGALAAASPALRMLGRGDHHPVLLLPGFTGGDTSTLALRWSIRSWGYWAHGWRLGANLGPTPEVVKGLEDRLALIHGRHGARVSLIGWSLGGIYARELARRAPSQVRQVITLASPFRMVEGDRSSMSPLAERVQRRLVVGDPMRRKLPEWEKPPIPVPTTSIYTRNDGVVRWHTCIDVADELHENVEVDGTHSGLGFNPSVLYVIADRLGQPADDWRPFHPPAWLRRLYPRPASWTEAEDSRASA